MGPLWDLLLDVVVPLLAAYLLALPIGWERERGQRHVGLRTYPLVAMGACGYLLLAQHVAGESPEARARVIQGLMTGIGFIGGGAILKQSEKVQGLATATSIWTTGAIGASVAFADYALAGALALGNLLVLWAFDHARGGPGHG